MKFFKSLYSELARKNSSVLCSFSKLKATPEAVERYKKDFYNLINVKKDHEAAKGVAQFLLHTFEPSLHLYNILLKGNIYMNDVNGIKETLALIASNKFAFNAVTLNLLLVYYRDLNLLEDADRLFQVIEQGDSPLINCAGPNLAAITTMMTGWQRKRNFDKVRYYFGKFEQHQIRPDEFVYNILLLSALEAKEFTYFDEVQSEMDDFNSFVIQKTIVKACIERQLNPKAALESLFRFNDASLELSEILKWTSKRPEKVALEILESGLNAKVRIGDPKTIHELMDRLSVDGTVRIGELSLKYRADLLLYSAPRLIQACANHSDPRLQEIFNKLRVK
jgi:hypothetical protein